MIMSTNPGDRGPVDPTAGIGDIPTKPARLHSFTKTI